MTRYSDIQSVRSLMTKALWKSISTQDVESIIDEAYPEDPDWLQSIILESRESGLKQHPQEVWSIPQEWLDSKENKQEITA